MPGRHGAGQGEKSAGRGGVVRGKGKIYRAGRGGEGQKGRKSTDLRVRQIFIGQNWILPCNWLPNFNGLKSTLPRCAPQVFGNFHRAGRGLDLVWESATLPTHIWEKSPKKIRFLLGAPLHNLAMKSFESKTKTRSTSSLTFITASCPAAVKGSVLGAVMSSERCSTVMILYCDRRTATVISIFIIHKL